MLRDRWGLADLAASGAGRTADPDEPLADPAETAGEPQVVERGSAGALMSRPAVRPSHRQRMRAPNRCSATPGLAAGCARDHALAGAVLRKLHCGYEVRVGCRSSTDGGEHRAVHEAARSVEKGEARVAGRSREAQAPRSLLAPWNQVVMVDPPRRVDCRVQKGMNP